MRRYGNTTAKHKNLYSRYLFAVSVSVVGIYSRPRWHGEQHFPQRGVRSGEADVSEGKFSPGSSPAVARTEAADVCLLHRPGPSATFTQHYSNTLYIILLKCNYKNI